MDRSLDIVYLQGMLLTLSVAALAPMVMTGRQK